MSDPITGPTGGGPTGAGATEPPNTVAQAPPKGGVRSYDELNTHSMVFEIQGTIGELKEAVSELKILAAKNADRLDRQERSTADIKDALGILTPKIDDLVGFTKHRAPHLADLVSLANLKADLKAEIDKRPTRRQAITDVALLVGLIGGLLTIGSHMAH